MANCIGDQARRGGHQVRIFGEFYRSRVTWRDPLKTGRPKWSDHWQDLRRGAGDIRIATEPNIPSLAGRVSPE